MNEISFKINRHWQPLLLLNFLLATVVVCKITLSQKTWEAKAELVLPNTGENLNANFGTLGSFKSSGINFSNTINPLLTQKSILLSNPVLKQVLDSDPEQELFSSVSSYKKLFAVSLIEKSNAFNLSVSASAPELAHQRTAKWIEAYQQRLNQLRKADNQSRQQFQSNQQQVQEAEQILEQAEQELAEFKQNLQLVNSEEQIKGMVKVINELTSLQHQAKAQEQANRKQIKAISQRLSLTPTQAIRSLSLGENTDYQFVRNKLIDIETRLNQLQTNFTNQEPRIQTLLQERKKLQLQLQKYINNASESVKIDSTVASDSQGRAKLIQQLILLESEAEGNQQQAYQLKSQIEQMSINLESIPVQQAQLLKLQRKINIAEGIYQGLTAQLKQTGINSFDTYPNVQVIDPPEAKSNPSSPDIKLIVFSSLLASVISSTALLLILEARNPLLSSTDLQSKNFPIVVSIPKFKNSAHALDFPLYIEVEFEKLASAIISQPKSKNLTSISNLQSSGEKLGSTQLTSIDSQPKQSHRLLITSAVAGEGKTTVTIGLAKALVNLGFKVLIVDGDYYKGELSQRFDYNPRNQDEIEQAIPVKPNLDLLVIKPLATEKAVTLISWGQFEERLRAVESQGNYDYVLIDTSPVSLTSEAVVMTSVIWDTLFVIRPGTSKRNFVTSSLEQLITNNSRILGLVVNGVQKNTEEYSYRSNYLLTSQSNGG